MCGIAGFSGGFDPALLQRMNDSIAHRGPDDAGVWHDAGLGIGFAHRRLSIIDLSALGHQPMWDVKRQVVIVFNGEIYNYRELRAELVSAGYSFGTQTDTEVLLNLYLRDGTAMLAQLNGIFAFAIYDVQSGSMFIARDQLGIKPLYYAQPNDGLVFASELKALLQEPSIPAAIDAGAVKHYLTYLWCPAPQTMLTAVKKLEPGYAMIVRRGRIARTWRYYDLPYLQPLTHVTETDAIAAVTAHVREAVRRQMVADVPVGAFLSGGLDSSAVVAFAREFSTGHKMQCFTIGFNGSAARAEGMTEDLPYARRVASHLGVDLHTIQIGPEMVGQLEEMIYHMDEPQADPAPLNVLFISRLARQHGIKVLLSGAGGDDIFTGYRRHYALSQEKYWGWLPQPIRHSLERVTGRLPTSNPTARRIRKAFAFAGASSDARLAGYFSWGHPADHVKLYGPTLMAHADAADGPLIDTLNNLPADTPALNRMLYLEGKHFLADHNLNYTDKMAMAEGVEVRVPLLDPDLVALAARLPLNYKQRGAVGKWIFKKAMEPYLPRDVIYRPKTGFGAPLRHWLQHELRPILEDTLSTASLEARGLFNPEGVQRLAHYDRIGKVDGSYTLFSMICIETWCRIFIDQRRTMW
jgi:asparagine synthase (glutamine-hydrolysing)